MSTAHVGPRATAAAYTRRHMVDAQVWRKETTSDGAGGQTVEWVDQNRTVPVQMVGASADERQVADQEGNTITNMAVLPTDADVKRGDRLVIGSQDPFELVSNPVTSTLSSIARAQVRQEHWDEPTT